MSEKLIESKIELDQKGDVIFKQLLQTDEQKPQWLDQNISAIARKPDPTVKGSMNSENLFLSCVAKVQGTPATELHQRLQAGETILIYPPPEISGHVSS